MSITTHSGLFGVRRATPGRGAMRMVRPRPVPSRVVRLAAGLVPLAAILVAWSMYAANAQGGVFPTVVETASGFWRALTTGSIWHLTLISWRSLGIGYAIAVPIGVAIGLALGTSRTLDRLAGVYLDISLVTPMIALMPIVLIALGVTVTAEVLVIIFFAVPYVVLPIRDGVRSLPAQWFDLGRSLGATRWQMVQVILIPGARAPIARGLRLGLGHAVSGLFTVELTLAALGIGQVVLSSQSEFRLGDVLGYIFFTLVQVVAMMALANLLDSDWREASA